MDSRRLLLMFAMTLLLFKGFSAAESKPATGFDQLKSLVGEWEGRAENGKTIRASYRLVSDGSALLETLNPPDEPEMVTVYHADGGRVAMTHYCSSHNQPHMRTAPVAGQVRQLAFSFVSASNLPSPEAGHMQALVVTLEDSDHFTQKWTWRENGGDKTEVFHFSRKK